MIRYMYGTDAHAKGTSPRTRTDDFTDTVKRKIDEYLRIGRERDVDFYLFGGDLFDSPYATPQFVHDIGSLLQEGLEGKPFFYVLGNHDMSGYNPATIRQTAYGVLLRFLPNAVELTSEPKPYVFNGEKIYLSGVHSYTMLDRDIEQEDGTTLHRSRDYVREKLDAPSIHVVHGYLSPTAILDDIPHTVIEDMRHTGATVTLTGHEHTGFAIKPTDGGVVYNPGAMSRVFASKKEMNRMPKIVYGEIDGFEPKLHPLVLESAVKGETVFDVEAINARNRQKAILEQSQHDLKETLASVDIQHVSVEAMLEGLRATTDPDVFEESRRRILNRQT